MATRHRCAAVAPHRTHPWPAWRRALLGLTLVLGSQGACGPDFAPPSKLDKLRVLGVRSTPAEVRPGEAVTLDALVFLPGETSPAWTDPGQPATGATPELRYSWRACLLETALRGGFGGGSGESGYSAERDPASCFDFSRSVTPAELPTVLAEDGGTDLFSALGSIALDLGHAPTAELLTFPLPPFPAPAAFCSGLGDAERQEQGGRELWIAGLRLMISLRVEAGSAQVVSNKRILLRPGVEQLTGPAEGMPFRAPRLCREPGEAERLCARNEQPETPEVLTPNGEWDGTGPIVVAPGEQIKLRPSPPPAASQPEYVTMVSCGTQLDDAELLATGGEQTKPESRFYAWYADGGSISEDETVLAELEGDRDSSWTAPKAEKIGSGQFTLYLVERDGRGGISWRTFPLQVR